MKKFARNVILCGAAFAMTAILTASNAQAQTRHNIANNRKPEPAKAAPMQTHNTTAKPQQNVAQPQQRPAIAPLGHGAKPVATLQKHNPVATPIPVKHEMQKPQPAKPVTVHPPQIAPRPIRPPMVEQPKVIVVEQPRKSLLEILINKIF